MLTVQRSDILYWILLDLNYYYHEGFWYSYSLILCLLYKNTKTWEKNIQTKLFHSRYIFGILLTSEPRELLRNYAPPQK